MKINMKVFKRAIAVIITGLIATGASSRTGTENMTLIQEEIDIGTTVRHEWFPFAAYNPVDNNYMIVWHTGGKLADNDTISHDSIDGQKLTAAGELFGSAFVLSPPEPGWKTLPKLAHNRFTNEYALTFTTGRSFIGQSGFTALLDREGHYIYGPNKLYDTPYNISHPAICFNPERREFLATYNENFEGTDVLPGKDNGTFLDNIGYILDEDARVVGGPFMIGSQDGYQFNPQIALNILEGTYLVTWEDFRNQDGIWDPSDLYMAVLDDEGSQIGEFPLIDDFGNVDEGDQRVQQAAYNSDKNEFLVLWRDKRPSFYEYVASSVSSLSQEATDTQGEDPAEILASPAGVVGRIIRADGTQAGGDFVVVKDAGDQGYPQVMYVPQKQRYFIVWDDTRSGNMDIYGRWLNSSGEPIGEEIPLCVEPGDQGYSSMAYNTLMDQILVTWRDTNAPFDNDVLPDEGGGHIPGTPGDIKGAIYGTRSFLSGRVADRESGEPLEAATVFVLGFALPARKATNDDGWFNVSLQQQRNGRYLVVVLKDGYRPAFASFAYEGVPIVLSLDAGRK